jgi:hypothetical protein
MLVAVIEWGKIGQVVWVAALASVLAITLYSIGIYGSSRAAEARRTRTGRAAPFVVLATVSLAAFGALVVFGLTVILNKS